MKLSWSKKLVRKWFNIKCKGEELEADEAVYGGERICLCILVCSAKLSLLIYSMPFVVIP